MTEKKYLLCEGRPPCCVGCENEFGECGTPCVDCDALKLFENEWEVFMHLTNEFVVYRRVGT